MKTNENAATPTMKVDNEKLKQLRLAKSWSQEKLANQAEITLRTVQRIESEGYASLRSLESLTRVLDTQPSVLIIAADPALEERPSGMPTYPNQRDLWLMLVAVIVCSLFIQIYGSLNELPLPAIVLLNYIPLCFISILIFATMYPIAKYRTIIYLSIIPIGLIFGPAVPFLLNKITMMIFCVMMFEVSNKAGALLRLRAIRI